MPTTPRELIDAAGRGDEALLRRLLAQGADPDAGQGPPVDTARRKKTALMAACQGGHEGCVKALLQAKASLRFVDPDGRDALAWAIEGPRPAKDPQLSWEAKPSASSLACLKLLLEAGAVKAVNKAVGKGYDKSTPLARATSWLDLDCMRLLLDHGADACQESMVHVRWLTNAASHIGRQWNSPLASAVSRGALKACEMLFEAGADPDGKPEWRPSIAVIAERCQGVTPEVKAFLKKALPIHAARQEAKAIEQAAGPANAPSKKARM